MQVRLERVDVEVEVGKEIDLIEATTSPSEHDRILVGLLLAFVTESP